MITQSLIDRHANNTLMHNTYSFELAMKNIMFQPSLMQRAYPQKVI